MIEQKKRCWECIDLEFSETECHECCQDDNCQVDSYDHFDIDRSWLDYQG